MSDTGYEIKKDDNSKNVFYRTYTFEKWHEAKNKIDEITMKDKYRINLYRGQENSEWLLKTSIERKAIEEKFSFSNLNHIEDVILEKFKKGIGHYHAKTFKTNKYEYLEIMQHYGSPTRLLDFTSSPYIAAYFAFEKPTTNKYISIWIFEGAWFSNCNLSIYNKDLDLLKESLSNLWNFKDYRILDNLIKQNIHGIIPVIPSSMDDRMLSQQSIFIVPTSIDIPFITLLENYYFNFNEKEMPPILKIDISTNARYEAIKDLNFMNINSRTIYPGIEGYTKSFNWDYELYIE